eukprot:6199559-Pleurochrysis_carterae.AAC.3
MCVRARVRACTSTCACGEGARARAIARAIARATARAIARPIARAAARVCATGCDRESNGAKTVGSVDGRRGPGRLDAVVMVVVGARRRKRKAMLARRGGVEIGKGHLNRIGVEKANRALQEGASEVGLGDEARGLRCWHVGRRSPIRDAAQN